jgi:transcriptional regulator with AAA-type ATPase domain/tetratricopeptide (TPR) repeat protein
MPHMKILADLVGDSPGIRAVRETVARLLARQQEVRRLPSILIQGETGTGKGLLARMIHRSGPRPDGPFIDVNCAAIPDTLLEAEMFGFERGAFTDARRSKPGLFQAAHRGTIFLDEVGLLPEGLQAKLLKVLEDRTIRRLGATRDEPVDVWVITATNEDLKVGMRERRFREDLYHRLAVLTVTLPPLRERGADILALAEHFLSRVGGEYGVPGKSLAADARAALLAYRWPGNVRELSNVIERAVLMSSANEITAEALGLGDATAPPADARAAPAEAPVSLDDAMREHLVEVLSQTSWNISRTAALLGISRNTLRARMDRYGLREREARPAARPRPVSAPTRAAPPISVPVVPAPVPPLPSPTARRWERRRLALLRVALVPPSTPNASLETARALETVVEKVRTFGGSVEGIGPIGLVAVFGLIAAGEVADRAAHVAMAIVKAVERARREETADLGVRIGLHAPMVLVGLGAGAPELDMDERRDLWPLLDELVERGRIDSVTVSAAAAALLTRRFELAAGPGTAGGEPTYQLVGRERTGLGLGSGLVAFVGRRHELQLLEDRLQSATRAQPQVVGIVGEAGIGKSRLIYEFRQTAAQRDVDYMEAHCLSYGSAVPFLPVLDLVRGCCHLTENDPPEITADRIRRALEDLGLEGGQLAPYLLHVLGIKDDPGGLDVVSHEALKTRVFEILRQVLRRRSRRRPLVLVLEDLHWIDTSSEEFFASLVDGLAGAPMLLIATYRSGYRPRWIEKSYATQIPLQPLDPSEARRIVRAVLRDSPVPDAVVDLLLAKAEGNAFFLQELALVVKGAGDPASPVVVPDTVQDVLLARIDRLAPDERDLLTSAAVVGKDFPLSVVQAIVALPEETVRRTLARLEAAEFVHETGLGPDVEYTFKHTLTHEVAYDCVRGPDRRRLHAGVLAALEGLREEPAPEHLERLAHHAVRAAVWDKAYAYLREAGVRAHAAGAHREAVAFFEQALAALAELPPSRERLEQAIDVRFELRTSLLPLGEVERGLAHLREAARLASELGDPGRLGRLTIYHVGQLYFMGEHERAWEVGQQALRLGDTLDDLALRTSTNTYLGQVLHARGEYRRAAELFRKNAEALRGSAARERLGLPQLPAVHSRACLVWSLAELGEFREALAQAEEGVALAEGVNQPLSRTVAYAGLGVVWLRQGEHARAIAVLERALDLIREWNIPLWFPRVASALGAALALGGRAAEAQPLLAQAVERATAMKLLGGLSLLVGYQAQAFLVLEDLEAAAAAASQALGLARHHGERGNEAMALRLVGEAALARGEAGAELTLDEACSLAQALEMRPLLVECHLALAAAGERRGDTAGAAAHRATARAIVEAAGMRSPTVGAVDSA